MFILHGGGHVVPISGPYCGNNPPYGDPFHRYSGVGRYHNGPHSGFHWDRTNGWHAGPHWGPHGAGGHLNQPWYAGHRHHHHHGWGHGHYGWGRNFARYDAFRSAYG